MARQRSFARTALWVGLLFAVGFLQSARIAAEDASGKRSEPRRIAARLAAGEATQLRHAVATGSPRRLWLVVESLIAGGQRDVAQALAGDVQGEAGEALRRYISAAAGTHKVRAAALEALEVVRARRGRPKQALRMLRGVSLPPQSVVSALAKELRGVLHGAQGQWLDASEAWTEAANEAETIGWLAVAGDALHRAAVCAYHAPDVLAARASWERLHRLQMRRGRARDAARTLTNLGSAAGEQADYVGALRYFERALALHNEHKQTCSQAVTLANMGLAHRRLGRYPEALALLERALGCARDSERPLDEAYILQRLGELRLELGDAERGIELHTQALAVAKAQDAKQSSLDAKLLIAEARGNLGLACVELGAHEEAEEHAAAALSHFEGLNEPLGSANCLNLLGRIAAARGALGAARVHFKACVVTFREAGDDLRALEAELLAADALAAGGESDLPRLEELLGEAERLHARVLVADLESLAAQHHLRAGAQEAAAEAARRAARALHGPLSGLSHGEGASAKARRAAMYDRGRRAGLALKRPDLVHEFQERGKAGALLTALGGRAALREATLPTDLLRQEQEARWAESAAQVRHRAAIASGSRAERRRAARAVEAAKRQRLLVHERIERGAQAAAKLLWPEPVPLEAVRQHLDSDQCMVHFTTAGDELIALVSLPSKTTMHRLGAREAVAAAVEALVPTAGDGAVAEHLPALRKRLVRPLALPSSVRRLVVIPCEHLTRLPLGMLFPDRDVSFAQSAGVWVALKERGDAQGKRVLGLGVSTARGELPALPNAVREVEAIADVRLSDDKATEEGLRAALNARRGRWRAVHFACHCLIDDANPLLSALVLHPDGTSDGYLSPLDLFRLPLDADLVTLSACNSGRGRYYAGEGLLGIVPACLFNGATSVLASLWPVDDDASRALMEKFYEVWGTEREGRRVGRAEALRIAQQKVKAQKKWAHPRFWAAWVLWGRGD